MKKHPLATVINFCTNEARFIPHLLDQVSLFSQQVIVSICDHFFDGTPENRPLLEEIYRSFPHVLFVEYPFVEVPKKVLHNLEPAHFWHSFSRLIGFTHVKERLESVLFLDADEVPDGERFREWLECSDYTLHTALKLSNYWYFREACYRADRWEDSIVLAQRKAITPALLLRQEEREAIYDFLPGPKRRHVTGVDGQPMFHHFSWVRNEEEMLKKVRSWGHKNDRDWESLVKKEFAAPFQGVDFVHGYKYETVPAPFHIDFAWSPLPKRGEPQLIRLSKEQTIAIALQAKPSRWRSLFGM